VAIAVGIRGDVHAHAILAYVSFNHDDRTFTTWLLDDLEGVA
jgi:hypothetical protein